VFGLLVVGVGMAFLAENLGWANAGDLLRFAPVGLMAVGLVKVLQDRTSSGRTFGAILLGIGTISTLDTFFLHDANIWRWWPLLIVGFGVLTLLKAFGVDDGSGEARAKVMGASMGTTSFGSRPAEPSRPGSMAQDLNEVAIWSGVNRRVSSPAFRRGNITAIMGGVEFDLRQAGTEHGEAVIDVFVIWGGIEIKVPPDWAVSNEITAIMGGAEDQSTGTQQARNRLIVRGLVIMGGVDIKT
jgi:predicted membrane protein